MTSFKISEDYLNQSSAILADPSAILAETWANLAES